MSQDDDRPGFLDREKKSFSELDRQRRERRDGGERRPAGTRGRAREQAATKQYLKQVDSLFSGGRGAELEKLAAAMREARGTPELAAACRAFRDAAGPPTDPRDISCFLDSGDNELVLVGLEAMRAGAEAGTLEIAAGLRTQLRMLAQDSDDAVAETAEELLEIT
jgi:hypothetical protein